MITLAVDAMGGDAGLAVTIPGALLFLRQQADVRLLMVGDEVQVRQALEAANASMDRIQIVHAAQVVDVDGNRTLCVENHTRHREAGNCQIHPLSKRPHDVGA